MKKFILIFAVILMGFAAQAQNQNYDFVQVSGEGEMKIKPEYVLIAATIYSRAQQAQAAQKLNAKEMARIDKILKQDFKIEAKDIQTSSFQVSPQYDYQQNKTVYKGMNVSHTVTIKYRKIDDAGNLLDRVLEGQNQEGFGVRIENISFGTDRLRELQAEVLEKAVADAKTRAMVLAKASGKKLKDIRKISDSQVRVQNPQPMRMAKMAMMAEDASAGTSIAPGEMSVMANVQAEFEIQ